MRASRPICIAAVALWAPALLAQPAEDRIARWREDLKFLATELPRRHVEPFAKISQDQFQRAVEDLDARIEGLSNDQIQVAMIQLVASIGDAHTRVVPAFDAPRMLYPFAAAPLSDGIFIRAVSEQHRDLLGAKVLLIGGIPVENAFERLASVAACDNQIASRKTACFAMVSPPIVSSLGIAEGSNVLILEVETADKQRRLVKIAPVDPTTVKRMSRLPDPARLKMPALQLPRPMPYWFEYLPEQKTMYVRYDRCANDPGKDVATFSGELFAAIDAGDVQKIIIDLRFNGGGNSALFKPIIEGLRLRPKLNERGRIFALIGMDTFSSALMNAQELKTQTAAILAGGPTAQKPNHFGEVQSFKLPNSQLAVFYSTKRFNLISGSDPDALEPQITAIPTGEEFLGGRDVVIEAVLAYPGK